VPAAAISNGTGALTSPAPAAAAVAATAAHVDGGRMMTPLFTTEISRRGVIHGDDGKERKVGEFQRSAEPQRRGKERDAWLLSCVEFVCSFDGWIYEYEHEHEQEQSVS